MLTRPTILCITFALAVLGTVALSTSCTQPVPNCASAYGSFAAEYSLIGGDPDSPCGQLPGDVLGLRTYYQEGGANGTPDYRKAKVAIRPESLGMMIAYAEMREAVEGDDTFYDANAIGSFTSGFPNDETFCMIDEFEPAQVSLPEIAELPDDPNTPDVDESQPAQPALDVQYRWRDARFVVSADAQGTQFEAELEVQQDGCTATYHVVGLYPAVGCESDDDCNDEENGINPDFAVRCNTQLGMCVLDGELPAYEDAE
jgi:hypothetical protein